MGQSDVQWPTLKNWNEQTATTIGYPLPLATADEAVSALESSENEKY